MEGQSRSKELIYMMVQHEREWKAFVGAYEKGEADVNLGHKHIPNSQGLQSGIGEENLGEAAISTKVQDIYLS